MGKYFCEVCKLFDDDVSRRSSQIWVSCLLYQGISRCMPMLRLCDFRSRNSNITVMVVEYVGMQFFPGNFHIAVV
jgi:hypothetical protein